jgi:outer membrane protein assembly factor BamB
MKRACSPLTAWRRLALLVRAAALFVCAGTLLPTPPVAAQTCGGPAFAATAPVGAPGAPRAVAVADFNRDGKLDAAVTDDNGEVTVYLGDGMGALTAQTPFPVGASPADIVAGDFDRDGKLDLAVASGTSVELYQGDGGGGFTSQSSLDVGVAVTRLTAADLDGNGRDDLVVVSQTGNEVIVLLGSGAFTFARDSPLSVTGPSAVAVGDFDRNGWPDLAVAHAGGDFVQIFEGSNGATLPNPPALLLTAGGSIAVGSNPVDVAVGDIDGDGQLDVVTADAGSGTATVLISDGKGGFSPFPAAVGVKPVRVQLVDLDRNGKLDIAALDELGSGTPQVTVLSPTGSLTLPFGQSATVTLTANADALGLAAGDVIRDGRPDLVVTEQVASGSHVVVVPNTAGPDCARSSFAEAARAFRAGDGPVAVAVADFDEDGTEDLVAAAQNGSGTLEVLRGSGGLYQTSLSLPTAAAPPHAVAAADFNLDGHADVVAGLGNAATGQVQLFLGDGTGGLAPQTPITTGRNVSAVVVGDFNGDGAPDVALASQGDDRVEIYLGDGVGGLGPPTIVPLATGAAPRALAVGHIDANATLDLVVANSGTSTVSILLGNGDGTFTAAPASPRPVGQAPWGVALGDFDGNGILDIVAANNTGISLSVLLGTGGGAFGPPATLAVDGAPIAVAALDVTVDAMVDIAVVTAKNTLNLLAGNGAGGFSSGVTFPVETRPSAVVPVDADADGRIDLAVPCRDADSVVLLLARPLAPPPGPPNPPRFATAPRFAVGLAPTAAVAADLDGDGHPDLAVVNSGEGTVSILMNEGNGAFPVSAPTFPVGLSPQAIVAADFDHDGAIDLAVSNSGAGTVSILHGRGGGDFDTPTSVGAGSTPDDLAVGDFNGDGAPDLAVCNRVASGTVTILLNDGRGAFTATTTVGVGSAPTSIFAADLDRNGALDLVVANDDSDNLTLLFGDGAGGFPSSTTLSLTGGDSSPVSVTGADLDGDGDVDLATAAFASSTISVFENVDGSFPNPPTKLTTSWQPAFVTAADLNRDGSNDLAVAAGGLEVRRAQKGLVFAGSEGFAVGLQPAAVVVADFDGDGRPDLAVVDNASNDVSILLGSGCLARRLVAATSPPGCGVGLPPFGVPSLVEARDDGGNLAACATGTVSAGIVPGTGTGGASLGGTPDVALDGGQALFNDLTVSLAGARYRLQFTLPTLPPVITRKFTLGPTVSISGPPSVCPVRPESHSVPSGYDSYLWTVDGKPYAFTPAITLTSPPLTLGSHLLAVQARIDACAPTDRRSVYLGNLASVALSVSGPTTMCVDCLGGTGAAVETGGGPVLGRQWGYRTASGGAITPIPGQAGSTYVLNGLDFPGPGTYYLVETTTPTCGTAAVSNEVTVTISPVVPDGEVRSLGVTSRGSGLVGENVLQWVNTTGSPQQILIRWNEAAAGSSVCSPPPSATSPSPSGEVQVPISPPVPATGRFVHSGLEIDTAYCYSIFVEQGGTYSPGRTVKGRPFDASVGPVRWAYATGATAVVPPTVAQPGIMAMSNDRSVHSLVRGILGGTWPLPWVPTTITGVAHSRSPYVPLATPVNGASQILFAGDDAGEILAVNAVSGQVVWGPVTPVAGDVITGAPGGAFVQYGAPSNVVLIGTRSPLPTTRSHFVALHLADGSVAAAFDGSGTPSGGLGPVSGTPSINNPAGLVYFASRSFMGTGDTVWCLKIDASGALTYQWSTNLGDIDGSPVVQGGRLYVGNVDGDVYSIDAATGSDVRPFRTGDGPVKGFLFPNRQTQDLFFATNSGVTSATDTAAGFGPTWTWSPAGLQPEIVLYWPGTDYIFVGAQDGRLYQLDFSAGPPSTTCDLWSAPTAPTSSCVYVPLGDGMGHVGAPSLDIGLAPPDVSPGKALLSVGSESGVLYAVEVPLQP